MLSHARQWPRRDPRRHHRRHPSAAGHRGRATACARRPTTRNRTTTGPPVSAQQAQGSQGLVGNDDDEEAISTTKSVRSSPRPQVPLDHQRLLDHHHLAIRTRTGPRHSVQPRHPRPAMPSWGSWGPGRLSLADWPGRLQHEQPPRPTRSRRPRPPRHRPAAFPACRLGRQRRGAEVSAPPPSLPSRLAAAIHRPTGPVPRPS